MSIQVGHGEREKPRAAFPRSHRRTVVEWTTGRPWPLPRRAVGACCRTVGEGAGVGHRSWCWDLEDLEDLEEPWDHLSGLGGPLGDPLGRRNHCSCGGCATNEGSWTWKGGHCSNHRRRSTCEDGPERVVLGPWVVPSVARTHGVRCAVRRAVHLGVVLLEAHLWGHPRPLGQKVASSPWVDFSVGCCCTLGRDQTERVVRGVEVFWGASQPARCVFVCRGRKTYEAS